jgi:hypothetical protein
MTQRRWQGPSMLSARPAQGLQVSGGGEAVCRCRRRRPLRRPSWARGCLLCTLRCLGHLGQRARSSLRPAGVCVLGEGEGCVGLGVAQALSHPLQARRGARVASLVERGLVLCCAALCTKSPKPLPSAQHSSLTLCIS